MPNAAVLTSPPPEWFPLRWQLPLGSCAERAITGDKPLQWWSAGWYEGERRQLILQLRRQPQGQAQLERLRQPVQPLLQSLTAMAAQSTGARKLLLVPIPSWRQRANPVPALLAAALLQQAQSAAHALLRPELLRRNRPVACQHRLQRAQRWRNQWLSFCALLPADQGERSSTRVLLIDDVLTSGATALAAQQALQSAGWSVAGLLCLARTPRRRDQA